MITSRILTAFFLSLFVFAATAQAQLPEKPNIIFILADDLGYGDTGVYNQNARHAQGLPHIETPRIDQMAAEGMRFRNMYACGPECSPTRGGLQTGFHTGHATVRSNGDYLRREDITVAEVLKRAGYATALIGKWGIGTVSGQTSPEKKGYDLGYGYLDNVHAWEHYTDYLYRNGVTESIPENSGAPGACTQEVVFTQDLFTTEALDFIQSNAASNTPFYLQLCYIIPHKWNVSPDLFSYDAESWPTIEKHFAAQVTYMDRDIGRILDRLVQLGIDNRTLVILTSDNGPQQTSTPNCGSHTYAFFDGNANLRDMKFTLYEGGIREPFIAWWPGQIQASTYNTSFIGSLENWMPTAAQLAGVPVPSGIDGVSMVPTLTSIGTQQIRPYFYWENGTDKVVRWGQYKGKWGSSSTELYDLAVDEGESTNQASNPTYSSILTQLTTYRNQARWSGAPPVTTPILALTGDVNGSGSSYTLNFGSVVAGSGPTTRTFRVRNAAASYSNLMEGAVDFQFSDSRLTGADGSYAWLVDNSNSDEFVVTLNPNATGTISGQVVITGRKYSYGTAVTNSPITLQIAGEVVATQDCNNNSVPDAQDILDGTSTDCNSNNIPDECELTGNDCNNNGILDVCEVPPIGAGTDCNSNHIPDACELTSNDCNNNGILDVCEVPPIGAGADCNSNHIPDACELTGNDCNNNGIPDNCDLQPSSPVDVVAHWRFEETSGGTVLDSGPNGYNGTLGTLPSRQSLVPVNPVPQTGAPNTQSLSMNWQSTANVGYYAASGSALSMGNQSFTIEAWVKLDYLSNTSSSDERQSLVIKKIEAAGDGLLDYGFLVQKGNWTTTTNYGKSSPYTGKELVLAFGTGSGTTAWAITSNLQIIDTNWHFVSVSFDPVTLTTRFGLDTTFETLSFTNGAHPTNTASLKVGAHTNTAGAYNHGLRGSIDELRISKGVVPTEHLLRAPGTTASADCNNNNIPDECEGGFNNLNAFMQELLAETANPALICIFDYNNDNLIDGRDIQLFVNAVLGG